MENMSKEDYIGSTKEIDKWMYEKTINLRKICNDKDFENLKKLGIKCKNLVCSEYEFAVLLIKMYEYYDYEKLKRKEKLTSKEERILDEYIYEQSLREKDVKKGYITSEIEERSLDGTGVSLEEYEKLLSKLDTRNMEIKLQQEIRIIERRERKLLR